MSTRIEGLDVPKYLLDKSTLLKYITAGNTKITLESGNTGKHFTYKIKKHRDKPIWFVSLLSNANNDARYQYIAYFTNKLELKVSPKSYQGKGDTPIKAFEYFIKHINNIPEALHVYHAGSCCRCGRTLTTPESIQSGIGPECAKLI